MFFTNIFDEQGRFIELKSERTRYIPSRDKDGKFILVEQEYDGQTDNHRNSYFEQRRLKIQMNEVMAFDREVA